MTDWAVGDLALCIKSGNWRPRIGHIVQTEPGPNVGQCFTVRAVQMGIADPDEVYLGFHGKRFQYAARYFRKVTPGADIEGVEEAKRLPQPYLIPERWA